MNEERKKKLIYFACNIAIILVVSYAISGYMHGTNVSDNRNTINRAREYSQDAGEQIDNARSEVKSAESKLDSADARITNGIAAINRSQEAIERNKAELAECERIIGECKSDNQQARGIIESIRNTNQNP